MQNLQSVAQKWLSYCTRCKEDTIVVYIIIITISSVDNTVQSFSSLVRKVWTIYISSVDYNTVQTFLFEVQKFGQFPSNLVQ